MKRQFSAQRLDVRAFAEDAGQLSGETALGVFSRLVQEAQGETGDRIVDWSATGEMQDPQHVNPRVWLHLQADTVLPMICQRCLEPVEIPVAVDRSFRFVADEETAAAEDDETEEDLLAISRAFDLLGLLEDELLMELPAVPRHDICPVPVKLSAADEDFEEATPERPFARLRVLKGGKE